MKVRGKVYYKWMKLKNYPKGRSKNEVILFWKTLAWIDSPWVLYEGSAVHEGPEGCQEFHLSKYLALKNPWCIDGSHKQDALKWTSAEVSKWTSIGEFYVYIMLIKTLEKFRLAGAFFQPSGLILLNTSLVF